MAYVDLNPIRAHATTSLEGYEHVSIGGHYLPFLTTPRLEPTNNIAERAIRFVVNDRRATQGSKSEKGQRWLEKIWTLMATCEQRRLSLFDCLRQTVTQHLTGEPPPSLLPDA